MSNTTKYKVELTAREFAWLLALVGCTCGSGEIGGDIYGALADADRPLVDTLSQNGVFEYTVETKDLTHKVMGLKL